MDTESGSVLTPAEMVVLQHLKRVGAASAKQIAQALHVTPTAVHHHLAVLEKAGLVATTLERRRIGRPACLYALSDQTARFFPHEYTELASRLLRSAAQVGGEAGVAGIFEHMRKNAVAQYAPRMEGKGFRERIAEMAKIQAESGYLADWQQLDENTFELTEHNCAILQVAREYPQACECELKMMQELLGATVCRQQHIAKGGFCCRYLIQAGPTARGKRS